MTRLLIVTDHRYFRSGDRIVDAYCFDRAFFDDYRAVFDEVSVAARIRSHSPPLGALQANGGGVSFVPLPDLRGGAWALAPWVSGFPQLRAAVAAADAVCLRIPAAACHAAFRYALALRKPIMFEMIGHPVDSWRGHKLNPARRAFIELDHWMTQRIVANAVVGSYVSSRYLQHDYPPRPGTTTAAISSVRLRKSDFTRPRTFVADGEPLRIVLVASLIPVKSHRTLLEALALASGKGASVRVVFAGDGSERDALAREVLKLGITPLVEFRGHIANRQELLQLLDKSDLFALPSLSEGLPRSMLEAMARGLPAIGTAVGGIMELLPPEQCFPRGDSRALAALLLRVHTDREVLGRWSREGFERAHDFSDSMLSSRRQKLLTVLRESALTAKQ